MEWCVLDELHELESSDSVLDLDWDKRVFAKMVKYVFKLTYITSF